MVSDVYRIGVGIAVNVISSDELSSWVEVLKPIRHGRHHAFVEWASRISNLPEPKGGKRTLAVISAPFGDRGRNPCQLIELLGHRFQNKPHPFVKLAVS